MLGITPPSGGELLLLLIMVATLGAIVAGMVTLFRLASHRGTGRTASTSPSDQQPPPGYWWDGHKWNPPDEPGQ